MPDIDVDFCMNRRGEVIQYVTEKYGREQVAQIITFNTLGARAAIKDVGRVLECRSRTWSASPSWCPTSQHQAQDAIERSRASRGGQERPARRRCAEVALRLEGLARNCSVHAAGVVISPQPLQGTGAALQDQPRRNCHAVRHERPGEAPASQDGFPGADHAHADPGRAALIQKRHGVTIVVRRSAARRQGHLRDLLQGLHQRRVPVRIERHARHPAPLPAEPHGRPDGAQRALPAGPDSGRHGGRFHRAQVGPQARCSTICRS
jgi:hypothetical protein